MTQISPENLDKAFDLLVEHAVIGARCPRTSGPDAHRLIVTAHISKLAREGRIFVEISGQNFRQITILTGPHKGAKTAPNPDSGTHVWQTVGKEGAKVNGKLVDHGARYRTQPSAPRIMSSKELSR